MWKARNIYDIRVAFYAIIVSLAALFLLCPIIYFFLNRLEYHTYLSDVITKSIYFVIAFLFLLSSASLLLGIWSVALYLYYRISAAGHK